MLWIIRTTPDFSLSQTRSAKSLISMLSLYTQSVQKEYSYMGANSSTRYYRYWSILGITQHYLRKLEYSSHTILHCAYYCTGLNKISLASSKIHSHICTCLAVAVSYTTLLYQNCNPILSELRSCAHTVWPTRQSRRVYLTSPGLRGSPIIRPVIWISEFIILNFQAAPFYSIIAEMQSQLPGVAAYLLYYRTE